MGILAQAFAKLDDEILQGRYVRILPADAHFRAAGSAGGLFALVAVHGFGHGHGGFSFSG
jgi:hypothetical protein